MAKHFNPSDVVSTKTNISPVGAVRASTEQVFINRRVKRSLRRERRAL